MTPMRHSESGQVLLITLLVLTIATVIGLSLVSRTATDTSLTRQVEESARAFNAAEAGIESALKTGSSGTQTIAPGLTFSTAVASVGGTQAYEYPRAVPKGTTATIWLVNHALDGTTLETPTYTQPSINLCWGAASGSVAPAVVVSILYKESSDGSYRILKRASDVNATRGTTNQFGNNGVAGACPSLASAPTQYYLTITFNAGAATVDPSVDTLLAFRVRPVYADAKLAVSSPASSQLIPFQGKRIESLGTTQSGLNRKVVVYQDYRAAGSIFDYVLYSQGAASQ